MFLLRLLICAGSLAAWTAWAQSPITVTVDTARHCYAIPDDFAGLGFETYAEIPDCGGVSGNLFSPTNTELITLFTNAGIRNLRVGGCTVDGLNAAKPDHTDVDNLFGFARVAGIKIIYSLRLLNGRPAEAAAAAKYIWDHYRSDLDCFAIGNEPDVKSYVYRPFGSGTDPAITNYSSYLAAWRKTADAVTNAVPGAKFAGPDAAGRIWAARFVKDEKGSGMITLITQHEYVGGRPYVNKGRGNLPAQDAIDHMLSKNWLANRYAGYYEQAAAPVEQGGLPWRMTEADDYLHGVTNASNAFASALWALDYMHWWAAHGCAGMNFHNNQHKEWLKTDTVYLDPKNGQYEINPKAYAIRAFDLGSHGFVEPVAVKNPQGVNLTAYAVGDRAHLCVTLINKEHGADARDAVITILPREFSAGNCETMALIAPNVAATSGISLGGDSMTNNAPWRGRWTSLDPPPGRPVTVTVPAGSALLVRMTAR